jgi:hypothetical protein
MPHNQRKNRLKPSDEERAKLIDLIWDSTEPVSDDDVEAWFGPPWRDLSYALQLASAAGGILVRVPNLPGESIVHRLWAFRGSSTLMTICDDLLPPGVGLYEYVNDCRLDLLRSPAAQTRQGLFLRAGLECVAKWIARSDGGGHVYNVYLQEAARQALWHGMLTEDELGDHMLAARMHDALGAHPIPKLAESFKVAWRAGRPTVAYLLASAR